MKCPECGLTMKVTREDVNLELVRDLAVRVHDLEVARDSNGHVERSLPMAESFARAVAAAIVKKPARLAGPEIRFLRTHLGWSAQEFASIVGADPASVSRWENGKDDIGPQTDRLLRALTLLREPIEGYDASELRLIGKAVGKPLHLEARLNERQWGISTPPECARTERSA